MKIVIVGGGKIGSTLAGALTKEDHDIVVIDNDRQTLTRLSESIDVMTVYGSGGSVSVMREAEAGQSDLLIAATPQDELNLLCCVIAKKLGCENTIARVRNPEYADQFYFLRGELGLNLMINPEWAAAREIFRLMQIPAFLKRDSFSKGRVEIVEIEIQEGGPLDGVALFELPRKVKVRVLVCVIDRGGEIFIPDGSFRLQAGDKISVTAAATELIALVRNIGMKSRKTKTAIIIGGGLITRYLTPMLIKTGARVKIIELKPERAVKLAELLPGATIIQADGSNQAVLKAESIEQMDTVVTLTDMDEENLIISMYANYVGVPQVITKINRTEYNEVFDDKGIDCVISPKLLCADVIIRYVRAMSGAAGRALTTIHYLADGKVEALEFNVTESVKNRGVTLSELKLKRNLLISCINRMGQIIIPGGSDTIELGDTIVVVTTANRMIADLNDIFAGE